MSITIIKCKKQGITEFFIVLHNNGSGGHFCGADRIPKCRLELVGDDPHKLNLLRSEFKEAYKEKFGRECKMYFV